MKDKRKKKRKAKIIQPKPAKHPGGRPTKFTPERRQEIIEAIKTGATYKAVAHFARISYDCLRDWIIKGARTTNENDEYFQFFQNVRQAEGSLQVRSLASIQKTGLGGIVMSEKTVEKKDGTLETTRTYSQPQWPALVWIMQHRFKEDWGDEVEAAVNEIPELKPKPIMTLKRETIDIYDPDRLARLIGAFAEADIIPKEIIKQFALPSPTEAAPD